MRIVKRGRKLPERPPASTRYEIRPHGDLRRPKTRPGKERRYRYVMMDHWTHRVVGYFANKRLADKEMARRKGMLR